MSKPTDEERHVSNMKMLLSAITLALQHANEIGRGNDEPFRELSEVVGLTGLDHYHFYYPAPLQPEDGR